MNNIIIINKEAFDRCLTTARLLGVRLEPEHLHRLSSLATLSEMNGVLIEIKSEARPALLALTEAQRELLRGHSITGVKIDQLLNDISRYEKQVAKLIIDQNECIRRIHIVNEEIEKLRLLAKDPPMIASIENALAQGTFKLVGVTRDAITFMTPDITCSWRDEKLGISLDAACGKYKIDISLPSLSVTIESAEEMNKRYCHPHVSSSGTPCWGSAATSLTQARGKQDIAAILSLTYGLLTTYNPDSPYIKLLEFDQKRNPTKYNHAAYTKCDKFCHLQDNGSNDNYIREYEIDADTPIDVRGMLDDGKVYVHEVYIRTLNGSRIDTYYYILENGSFVDVEDLNCNYEIRSK
jgi:hypothetical protein